MRFKEFTHLSCTKAMWMLCALLMSCTGGKTENEDDKDNDTIPADSIGELLLFDKPVVPESVDANFDDFLYTFINDEEFCGQRVQYPLTVVENGKEKVLKQGQWKDADVFKSQELLAFIYNHDKDLLLLKSDSVTDVDLEWIDFEAMSVDIYEFHKEKQWKMIKCTKGEPVDEKYAEFAQFYERFMNDTEFQHKSVALPLTVVTLSEGEMYEGGTEHLNLQQWDEFHQQTPMPQPELAVLDYDHDIAKEHKLNLLVRSVNEPLFATYKFKKNGKTWKLYEVEI